jgi:cytochrome c
MKFFLISILGLFSFMPITNEQKSVINTQDPPTFKDVEPLLKKYTCLACHTEAKKLVGPSYKDIAKKEYSDEEVLKLIYKPKPENWPGFPPMAPMANVKKADGLKIAAWINSLD